MERLEKIGGTWFLGLLCEKNHSALAEFATDVNCDWQWTPLINNVHSINLTDMPKDLRLTVWAIDDRNRNWKLGAIFECKVGKGKLLVSAIDLNDERGSAALKQLRRSVLDYTGSKTFTPQPRGRWNNIDRQITNLSLAQCTQCDFGGLGSQPRNGANFSFFILESSSCLPIAPPPVSKWSPDRG
jgi:hypothetical protein